MIGRPDDTWGEIVAAVVTTHEPAAPGLEQEPTGHCLARLTPFKVPARWFFRDELPHTASGKVQKFVLRDELVRRLTRPHRGTGPAGQPGDAGLLGANTDERS